MALDYEDQFFSSKIRYIVGTDEAGRGSLAGPVCAAAVILPKNFKCEEINDSKQLSDKKRRALFIVIKKRALAYAIAFVTPKKIDEINILEASRLAMSEAICNLNHEFDMIISDAMKLPQFNVLVHDLIKGDEKAECVAAASILAKVARDDFMIEMDKKFPLYNFKVNKGYGTKSHLLALEKYGPIKDFHRFSYKPVINSLNRQITLF